METRVTILERDVQEIKALLPLIHAMDKKLDMALMKKECPNPGACLQLAPRVDMLDNRLTSLEMSRAESRGSWKAIAGLITASGFIGAALSWPASHFTNKP